MEHKKWARWLWLLMAVSGFLAVAMGAFGAHVVRDELEHKYFEIYQTAVQYQFYNVFSLALALVLYELRKAKIFLISASVFFVGGVIFSTTLYVLVLCNLKWLGAVTPIGGVLILIAWLLLGKGVFAKSS